jgi:ATP-dependent Clp protease ATP-binding subunit ClpA
MVRTGTFEQNFEGLKELAIEEAKKWGHSEIDTDHLLAALLDSEDNDAYKILERIVDTSELRKELEQSMSRVSGKIPLLPTELTKQAQSAYEFAGHSYVYDDGRPKLDPSIHFILGIIDQGINSATPFLQKYGITRQKVMEHAEEYRTD